MTLHQGQGHGNEHEYKIVYTIHKSTVMSGLDAIVYKYNVRDKAIGVQVKHLSSLRRTCDLERSARLFD